MIRIESYANRKIRAAELVNLQRLVLPFELRQKSRLRTALDNGAEVALFLPRGTVLRDGDLLEGRDGSLIRVVAAPEKVFHVTADKPHDLMRAAFHLGNRHIPVELGEDYLKLESDPVLKEMLLGLGVTLREDYLPFQPEAGAYGGGHRHGHDSTFAEEYARAQGLFDEHHGHEHSADEEHRHPHPHDDTRGHRHS
jgi:urease accessory protein